VIHCQGGYERRQRNSDRCFTVGRIDLVELPRPFGQMKDEAARQLGEMSLTSS
jgi:hypothetical protein